MELELSQETIPINTLLTNFGENVMGLNLGGLVGALSGNSPLASLAISAMTGGVGGLAMEFTKQVASQVAKNVIQDLPLPQFTKDLLSQAVEGYMGEGLPGNPGTAEGVAEMVAEFTGGSLQDAQSSVDDMQQAMQDLIMGGLEVEEEKEKAKAEALVSGGGSWIMIFSEMLGELMDAKFEEMKEHIEHVANLGEQSLEDDGGWGGTGIGASPTDAADRASAAMPSATAEMQGKMQEFNMIMNAVTNAIKTSGQSASQMASKN